jgi:hypothetical protein
MVGCPFVGGQQVSSRQYGYRFQDYLPSTLFFPQRCVNSGDTLTGLCSLFSVLTLRASKLHE